MKYVKALHNNGTIDMADITMCNNDNCTLKELCYRYTATPTEEWQAYAKFEQDESGMCEHFVKNEQGFMVRDGKMIPLHNVHDIMDLLRLMGVTVKGEQK